MTHNKSKSRAQGLESSNTSLASNKSPKGQKGGQISAESVSSGSKTMADLLLKQSSKLKSIKKGDTTTGTITKLTPHDMRAAIGGKSEAKIIENDRNNLKMLHSILKVGDKVEVQVINAESDMGYPLVSLRRFVENKLWGSLEILQKEKTSLEVTVTDATRGGFLVNLPDGMQAFLPNSHTSFTRNPGEILGKSLKVAIVELNKAQKKLIVSQKAAGDEHFTEAAKIIKIDQVVSVTVTNITSYGLFVSLELAKDKYVDGFIHQSEVSWEKTTNLEADFRLGQTLEVKVLGFDEETKRVNLSIKQLAQDPFTNLTNDLSPDQALNVTVKGISDAGVLLILLAHESLEVIIPKDKIPPAASYEVGQKLSVTVSEIDLRKRRVIVSPVLLRKTIGYR